MYLLSGETGPTEIICDFREGKATSRDFGVRDEGDLVGDRLWGVRGDRSSRLLVISTPFVEGRHWAVSPSEFRPLVAQLESLHGKGYVHGDIRCFNIAFGPNQGSRLFDFDLGGRVVGEADDDDDDEDGPDSPQLSTYRTSEPESDPATSGGMIPPWSCRRDVCYPAGNRQDLADGIRLGVGHGRDRVGPSRTNVCIFHCLLQGIQLRARRL